MIQPIWFKDEANQGIIYRDWSRVKETDKVWRSTQAGVTNVGSITTMLKGQGEEPSASSRVGPSISEVSARGKVMKEGGNRDEMGKKYSSSLVFSPSDPVDASWWPNVTESQPAMQPGLCSFYVQPLKPRGTSCTYLGASCMLISSLNFTTIL